MTRLQEMKLIAESSERGRLALQRQLDAQRLRADTADGALQVANQTLAQFADDLDECDGELHRLRDKLAVADHALGEAQRALVSAVKNAYPVGSRVMVNVGRAKFEFEVTGYGSYWENPGRLSGFNTKTGNVRFIHHDQIKRTDHDQ